ncbi:MAG: hypothetical protein IJS09_03355 [Treponema sp.]|nr:hypothetical protein [Treponema sp.]
MKKIIVFLACFVLTLSALSAQVSVDPNDRFYQEAQIWEVRGLIDRLPQIRPYPLNLVKSILETVIFSGLDEDGTLTEHNKADVELALYEYERIFSKPFHVQGTGGGIIGLQTGRLTADTNKLLSDPRGTSVSKFLQGKGAVVGDVALHPLVSFSFNIGENGKIGSWGDVSPMYSNYPYDAIQDAAEVGPLELYFDANSNISVGTKDLYATAGMSRVGFGPFLGEGLCLNETSYHSANMFMNISSKFISFTTLFSAIGAKTNYGDDNLANDKYFAMHSVRFNPFKALSISFYESVVYGGRTDLSYLIPAPFMVIQGLGGNRDNLQMGLLVEYSLLPNFRLNLDIYVDDFDVEKLAKLKLDGKNRFAIQGGFLYTPPASACKLFGMTYSLVTPYTYTHWQCVSEESGKIIGTGFNYQNYTNNGINIGSSLQPDSDRVAFTAQFQPKKNLKITLASSMVRHQNVVESLTDAEAARYMIEKAGTYRTDGSIYTHSMYSAAKASDAGADHVDSAWSKLLFMSGNHTMYSCQAGVNAEYEIPSVKKWRVTLKFGYTFEYVHNKGVDSVLYPGDMTGYVAETQEDGSIKFAFRGVKYDSLDEITSRADVQAETKAAYENWVGKLFDQVNNFFSLSVKLTY